MDQYDVLDDDDNLDVEDVRGYNYYNEYNNRDYYDNLEDHPDGSHGFARINTLWRWWTGDGNGAEGIHSNTKMTQWGILVALVVVCAVQFQFQSFLWALWYKIREDGLMTTIIDMFFSLWNIIGAYFQLAMELVRSLRHNTPLSYFFDGFLGGGGNGFYVEGGYDHPPAAAGRTGFFSGGAVGPPPPLVIVGPNGVEEEETGDGSGRRSPSPASSFSSRSTAEQSIEPAFLNDEDYPPGWLVFHTELGVVPKEEADAYDTMIQRKQQEAQKLHNDNEDEKKSAESNDVKATIEGSDAMQAASNENDRPQEASAAISCPTPVSEVASPT